MTNQTGTGSPSGTGDQLQWTEWRPKDVIVRQVEFTGFGDDGNGWAILNFLHDRGITAYGRDDSQAIYFETDEREEAIARLGYWFVVGTEDEVYAIKPAVHTTKYRAAS